MNDNGDDEGVEEFTYGTISIYRDADSKYSQEIKGKPKL